MHPLTTKDHSSRALRDLSPSVEVTGDIERAAEEGLRRSHLLRPDGRRRDSVSSPDGSAMARIVVLPPARQPVWTGCAMAMLETHRRGEDAESSREA